MELQTLFDPESGVGTGQRGDRQLCRLSRIVMSRELTSNGLAHIVIPTVFRSDYLDALRALTRRNDPSIFVRSMARCQQISAACSGSDRQETLELWARTYAFVEAGTHARLEWPDPAIEVEWRNETPAPTVYWLAMDREKEGGIPGLGW